MCVCNCARSLGLTLVTVTQSQSQSAFDLSGRAAAEAAAAQRFLLLYSLYLRSISFRFRRLQMLFSLSHSHTLCATLIHTKSSSIYIGSHSYPLIPPPLCSPFAFFIRSAHSVQLNLITQVRGCLSGEFICLRILNLRAAYVTQVTLRTYV